MGCTDKYLEAKKGDKKVRGKNGAREKKRGAMRNVIVKAQFP